MKSGNGRGPRSVARTRLWSDGNARGFTGNPRLRGNDSPLALQRLIVSTICGLFAFALTAAWLDLRVRQSLFKEVAQSSSWFVEDHIQPILRDLQLKKELPDTIKIKLAGIISKSMLGHRLVEMRIWSVEKDILFSTDPTEIGRRPPAAPELSGALAGATTFELLDRDDPASPPRWRQEQWMLEVFYPVRARGTNSVIAVAELYLDGAEFVDDMNSARRQSWLVSALLSAAIFFIVFGFVWHANKLLASQLHKFGSMPLQTKKELSLIEHNKLLAKRIRQEQTRNVELSDRLLRHIGADLHDGPAQLLSIALLRLGEISTGHSLPGDRLELQHQRSVDEARRMTRDALAELRGIAKGLILPHLENLQVADAVRLAVGNHEKRTLTKVKLDLQLGGGDLPLPLKTCLYRCTQEGLNNAYRHGGGREQVVSVTVDGGKILLMIKDAGPGIAPDAADRSIDALGIAGLRNRVEILGGQFSIVSAVGAGTTINVELPLPVAT